MTTNSHMFTVLGTTFGAFCAASFFALSFIFLVIGHYGSVRVQGKNSPANIATLPPPPPLLPLASLTEVCVCWSAWNVHILVRACLRPQYEGCSCSWSTKPGPCVEMQPPGWAVLSLPTSPAGSRGSSWLVALCLQTDGNGQRRGEVENQRGGGGGGGGIEWTEEGEGEGMGGRKSQSVLIKCCIEDDIPPQCVSSSGWSPSHSDSRSDHLYRGSVIRCVCMH